MNVSKIEASRNKKSPNLSIRAFHLCYYLQQSCWQQLPVGHDGQPATFWSGVFVTNPKAHRATTNAPTNSIIFRFIVFTSFQAWCTPQGVQFCFYIASIPDGKSIAEHLNWTNVRIRGSSPIAGELRADQIRRTVHRTIRSLTGGE